MAAKIAINQFEKSVKNPVNFFFGFKKTLSAENQFVDLVNLLTCLFFKQENM